MNHVNTEAVVQLDDDITEGLFNDSIFEIYRKRPKKLEHFSLYQFTQWYEKKSAGAADMKLINGDNYVKKRTKFLCIRTSFVMMATDDYYYHLVLLHFPHRHEFNCWMVLKMRKLLLLQKNLK